VSTLKEYETSNFGVTLLDSHIGKPREGKRADQTLGKHPGA